MKRLHADLQSLRSVLHFSEGSGPRRQRISIGGEFSEVNVPNATPRVSLALVNGQMISFEDSPRSHCLVIDPLSKWKVSWDVVLLLLVLYQALLVPVELAFVDDMTLAQPFNAYWCIDMLLGALFMLDIAFSSITSFVKEDGTYVGNQKRILVNYMATPPFYFFIDVAALVPFFLSFVELSYDTVSLAKASKTGRILRYLRMFRLLRLLRLARAFKVMRSLSREVVLSGRYAVALAGFGRLSLAFCLCVHLGACLFRAACDFDPHASAAGIDSSELWESYTFSVWWLVSTISGGSSPVEPSSIAEMWLFSLFGFLSVSFVTVATGMLVQILDRFHEDNSELDQTLRVASKFVSEHAIDEHVKASVLGAVRASFSQQRRGGRFKDLVDPLLSEDLRRKLYGGIYGNLIKWFPPFCEDEVPERFRAKLALGAGIQRYVRGEHILYEGEKEDSMLFLVEGTAMLQSVEKRMRLPIVSEKWFIGERALFCSEVQPRQASLTALKPCESLTIHREHFIKAVKDYNLDKWFTRQCDMLDAGQSWGCPACGQAGHWIDDCDTLVVAAQEGTAEEAFTQELVPLYLAAQRNFLASIRPSQRTSKEQKVQNTLHQLLEEARATLELAARQVAAGDTASTGVPEKTGARQSEMIDGWLSDPETAAVELETTTMHSC